MLEMTELEEILFLRSREETHTAEDRRSGEDRRTENSAPPEGVERRGGERRKGERRRKGGQMSVGVWLEFIPHTKRAVRYYHCASVRNDQTACEMDTSGMRVLWGRAWTSLDIEMQCQGCRMAVTNADYLSGQMPYQTRSRRLL